METFNRYNVTELKVLLNRYLSNVQDKLSRTFNAKDRAVYQFESNFLTEIQATVFRDNKVTIMQALWLEGYANKYGLRKELMLEPIDYVKSGIAEPGYLSFRDVYKKFKKFVEKHANKANLEMPNINIRVGRSSSTTLTIGYYQVDGKGENIPYNVSVKYPTSVIFDFEINPGEALSAELQDIAHTSNFLFIYNLDGTKSGKIDKPMGRFLYGLYARACTNGCFWGAEDHYTLSSNVFVDQDTAFKAVMRDTGVTVQDNVQSLVTDYLAVNENRLEETMDVALSASYSNISKLVKFIKMLKAIRLNRDQFLTHFFNVTLLMQEEYKAAELVTVDEDYNDYETQDGFEDDWEETTADMYFEGTVQLDKLIDSATRLINSTDPRYSRFLPANWSYYTIYQALTHTIKEHYDASKEKDITNLVEYAVLAALQGVVPKNIADLTNSEYLSND